MELVRAQLHLHSDVLFLVNLARYLKGKNQNVMGTTTSLEIVVDV